MFAQAMSSTHTTAAKSTSSPLRTWPIACSRRGTTVAPQREFVSGRSRSVWAAIAVMSACAAATVTAGRRRATVEAERPLRPACAGSIWYAANTSAGPLGSTKPAGITPTTSQSLPLTATLRPMTSGEPPYPRCQRL